MRVYLVTATPIYPTGNLAAYSLYTLPVEARFKGEAIRKIRRSCTIKTGLKWTAEVQS